MVDVVSCSVMFAKKGCLLVQAHVCHREEDLNFDRSDSLFLALVGEETRFHLFVS